MRKKIKIILTRLLIILPATVLQIGWYILFATLLNTNRFVSDIIILITSFVLIIFLLYKRDEPNYKLLWVILICLVPLVGVIVYLMAGNKRTVKPTKMRITRFNKTSYPLPTHDENLAKIKEFDKRDYQLINLVHKLSTHPVNKCVNPQYYSKGEYVYEQMLEDLRKANKFIFIEYFIIDDGIFFDEIKKILIEKHQSGVDVRLMFDDFGSVLSMSLDVVKDLLKEGIEVTSFNPIKVISTNLNNRDHRKMMIIDNKVCYSGGINIADEYINKKVRFGDWKDIAFRIEGEEVLTYTSMFIKFWNAYSLKRITDYTLYQTYEQSNDDNHDGYIISYSDAPYFDDHLSVKLFLDLLATSKEYVYIYTPYLLISDMILEAIFQAADRGVDVRILVPGIPDKKFVNRVTKSYYLDLLNKNVKIYEYTPGFLHAKAWIVDDKFLSIGSVNLDYRSLYLNFENSSVFYQSSMIKDVKKDFVETLKLSTEIKIENLKGGIFRRVVDAIVRIISPLI